MRAIKFCFADDKEFDGFTDDSTWNGFDNVWVTAEVHAEVRKYFLEVGYNDEELGFSLIEPDNDGLYSYANGFATCEVESTELGS